MKRLTEQEKEQEHFRSVGYRMRHEGFHYCFDGYSDWGEIKDEKFQKLRLKYLDAAEKLKKYVNYKEK